jgi:hypothetical protein
MAAFPVLALLQIFESEQTVAVWLLQDREPEIQRFRLFHLPGYNAA